MDKVRDNGNDKEITEGRLKLTNSTFIDVEPSTTNLSNLSEKELSGNWQSLRVTQHWFFFED